MMLGGLFGSRLRYPGGALGCSGGAFPSVGPADVMFGAGADPAGVSGGGADPAGLAGGGLAGAGALRSGSGIQKPPLSPLPPLAPLPPLPPLPSVLALYG